MRSEYLALPICAAIGLAVQPARAALGPDAIHVAICGEDRSLIIPLGKRRSGPAGHGDPCSLACHADGPARRRDRAR